jgi:hypothetical protein
VNSGKKVSSGVVSGSKPKWRALQRSARWSVPLVLLCVLAGGGIAQAQQTPSLAESVTASSGPTQGAILSPLKDSSNIPVGNTLTAYGTIRNLKPGNHLLLFLRVGNNNSYFGGDPQQQIVSRGAWSVNIYIPSLYGQQFTLYLTDLGPKSWAFISGSGSASYWNKGFPSPAPGTDATVLYQVSFKGWKPKS